MSRKSNIFKDILYIFPVMIYFAFEALIVAVFISLVWKFLISQYLGDLGYFQVVGFYWIAKMILFDVFKLISGLSTMSNKFTQQPETDEEEDNVLTEKDFR